MRSFVLVLLLIGIVLVTIGYSNLRLKCPPPRIQYRILPQSYIEEQLSGKTNSEVLQTLFNSDDPFFRDTSLSINTKSDNNTTIENFYNTY